MAKTVWLAFHDPYYDKGVFNCRLVVENPKGKPVFVIVLAGLAASLATGLAQPVVTTRPVPQNEGAVVYRDLVYVLNGHERQKLGLYLPNDGTNLPPIVNASRI